MSADAPLCLPPLPPRAPARRLPAGTCDTHMHVFGPVARYPLAPVRSYTPHPVGLDAYRAVMDTLGIDRAVLVQPSVYGQDNSALLDALRQMPDALRGVAVVRPDLPEAELHALHAAGVRGVRVNRRNPGGLTLDDMDALARRIAPLNWHIQLQIELDKGADLAAIAARCDLPLVIDHFGFPEPGWGVSEGPFADLLRLMAGGRVWVKASAPYRISRDGAPYGDVTPFLKALADTRADRVLWATDWPHTELWDRMPEDADLVDGLDAAGLNAEIRSLILVENPARLYGFGA